MPKPSIQPPWLEKEANALDATPPPRLQLPGRSAARGFPLPSLLFKARPCLDGTQMSIGEPELRSHGAVQPELGDCLPRLGLSHSSVDGHRADCSVVGCSQALDAPQP